MSITNKVIKTIKDTIQDYNMFHNGDTVVVGVSGGADSVMLLHCLNTLKDEYNLNLVVAHVNHKIRKGDAENDAAFVENMCNNLGVNFHLKEAYIKDLAKEWGMGEEEAGRQVRYGFFNELAGDNGKIVTAHNANDNVETILMRFMRGTGVNGLGGISYKRDNIVRPLLSVSREDIEGYIEENGLTHITDKTNFESIYTRNKIRLDLIPYLKETFNPNLVNTLTTNIENYREDADYLNSQCNEWFEKHCITGVWGSTTVECNKNKLVELHPSIAKRVIIKAIQKVKGVEQIGVNPEIINGIYKGLRGQVGTQYTLNEGYVARIDYDFVVFEKVEELEKNVSVNTFVFETDTVIKLSDLKLELSVEKITSDEIVNTANTCYVPFEVIEGKEVIFRTRRDGDKFRIDEACHRKLNKLFIDRKITSNVRDSIPLMVIDSEVNWLVGYQATRFEKRSGEFVRFRVLKNFN